MKHVKILDTKTQWRFLAGEYTDVSGGDRFWFFEKTQKFCVKDPSGPSSTCLLIWLFLICIFCG